MAHIRSVVIGGFLASFVICAAFLRDAIYVLFVIFFLGKTEILYYLCNDMVLRLCVCAERSKRQRVVSARK